MMTLADGETVSYLGAQPPAITPQSVSVHTARNKSVNYLFIAPEYLFTANNAKQMTVETYREIVAAAYHYVA